MLRASRRDRGPASPSGAVKGSTVTPSAPPSTAPMQASVVRKRLEWGSRRAIMRHAVSAWRRIGRGARPQLSSTLAQRRRSARNLDIVKTWSTSATSRNDRARRASSSGQPALVETAQIGDRRGEHGLPVPALRWRPPRGTDGHRPGAAGLRARGRADPRRPRPYAAPGPARARTRLRFGPGRRGDRGRRRGRAPPRRAAGCGRSSTRRRAASRPAKGAGSKRSGRRSSSTPRNA